MRHANVSSSPHPIQTSTLSVCQKPVQSSGKYPGYCIVKIQPFSTANVTLIIDTSPKNNINFRLMSHYFKKIKVYKLSWKSDSGKCYTLCALLRIYWTRVFHASRVWTSNCVWKKVCSISVSKAAIICWGFSDISIEVVLDSGFLASYSSCQSRHTTIHRYFQIGQLIKNAECDLVSPFFLFTCKLANPLGSSGDSY